MTNYFKLHGQNHAISTRLPLHGRGIPKSKHDMPHIVIGSPGLMRCRGSNVAVHAGSEDSVPAPDLGYTCRRCRTRFMSGGNHKDACRYHPDIFTGGEVAKAMGFVRRYVDRMFICSTALRERDEHGYYSPLIRNIVQILC